MFPCEPDNVLGVLHPAFISSSFVHAVMGPESLLCTRHPSRLQREAAASLLWFSGEIGTSEQNDKSTE